MIIADQLRQKNRAEYLLYLWQVEDIIRAYSGDIDRLKQEYLSRFDVDDSRRQAMYQWYADLCEMMRSEGCMQGGHLRLSMNVLDTLDELHRQLLRSSRFPYYREMYYKVLPYVVELRQKGGHKDQSELQTCFEALYGVMMLRMQHKPISDSTAQAAKDIATLLGQLSDYYFKDQAEPINFDD